MVWSRVLAMVSVGLAVACGSPAEPMGMESDGEDTTTTGEPPDDGSTSAMTPDPDGPGTGDAGSSGGPDDTGTTDDDGGESSTTDEPPAGSCQPTPTRMVVLGDSITACAVVGGKNSDDCSPKRLNDYFAANYGPITYENLAVGGAVTTDVSNSQIFNIDVGMPGHVIVVIYIGGNDLAPYIFQSDQAALDGWNNTTGPAVAQAWEEILAFLGDPANFPDGVTLLMNTQYNPFDDCTAPPYFVSETKIMLLHAHNDALTERANSQPWAFIADQHPSFLGHGHYVNDSNCPYYDPSFEGWMGDLIHPNAPGHHNLADMMVEVAEQEIYAGCD